MANIKIAAAQFENKNGDKDYNLSVMRELTKQAVDAGAEVVSFHEGCICAYSYLRKLSKDEFFDVAEPIPDGPSITKLMAISAEFDVPIFAGMMERDGDEVFNAYFCVYQGQVLGKFRKLHAFINPHLSSGSDYVVFDLLGWKFGMLICYDTHLAENVRITTLMGAEIIMMPNVTCCLPGSDPSEGFVDPELWHNRENDPISIQREFSGPKGRVLLMKWLPTRAYENGVYVIFTNPIGVDDDQIRNGNAMILDPNGNVIAETTKLADDFVIASCNKELTQNAVGKIFINARRPDLYGELLKDNPNKGKTKVAWM